MKLSKERKMYIALFSAGLVALAVDRAIFSPAQADAGEPEAADPGAEAAAAAPEAQATKPRGPSFGARLAERASWVDSGVPDAFEPSEAWVGRRVATVEEVHAAGEPESAFAQRHKLNAVVFQRDKEQPGAEQKAAFIGGKQYRIGERLDGYELIEVKIAEREAVFKGPGGVVTLRVPGPGGGDRGTKGP